MADSKFQSTPLETSSTTSQVAMIIASLGLNAEYSAAVGSNFYLMAKASTAEGHEGANGQIRVRVWYRMINIAPISST